VTANQTKYVALLRGVNLGPRNRVAMARLREVIEGLGCENVRTYIASGNVLLSSPLDRTKLSSALQSAILREFAISIQVVVLTAPELARVVHRNPFKDLDPSVIHVGFAAGALEAATVKPLQAIADNADEKAVVDGRQIYFHLPHGLGGSRLTAAATAKVKPPITIRNWRTVQKLNDMASEKGDT
jgi:uncharacterized protein (DUF1697 family)